MPGDNDHLSAHRRKQEERIDEFKAFGVKAKPGVWILGSIQLSATEAEKVLRLLRKGAKRDRR